MKRICIFSPFVRSTYSTNGPSYWVVSRYSSIPPPSQNTLEIFLKRQAPSLELNLKTAKNKHLIVHLPSSLYHHHHPPLPPMSHTLTGTQSLPYNVMKSFSHYREKIQALEQAILVMSLWFSFTAWVTLD